MKIRVLLIFDGHLLCWENGRILYLSMEHSINSEIRQSGGHLRSSKFDRWFSDMTCSWEPLGCFIENNKYLSFIFKRFGFNSARSEAAISLPAYSDALGHGPVFRNHWLRHCPEMTFRITVKFRACNLHSSIVLFVQWWNCEGEVEGFLWRRDICFIQQLWRDTDLNTTHSV